MATIHSHSHDTTGPGPALARREASVLVPVYRDHAGALHVVMMLRAPGGMHGSQIAFPGGRREPGDASDFDTALRETEEEIGIARADVDVLGVLDPIHTFTSNFLITPFVARVPHPYPLRADPREVAEIFTVPVATLDDPATRVEETWTIEGRAIPVTAYRLDGRVIWGATQRITAALLDLLTALAHQD